MFGILEGMVKLILGILKFFFGFLASVFDFFYSRIKFIFDILNEDMKTEKKIKMFSLKRKKLFKLNDEI